MPRARADSGATLAARLRDRIRRQGPMPVDAFMRACLEDPVQGYRLKADSIGAAGDFVTAPEISQVFGELIGLWCAVVWQGMGRPVPLRLVELGPGRGTLMRDALRATKRVPAFAAAATVHLVEISAPLRRQQRRLLRPPGGRRGGEHGGDAPPIAWHTTVADVPPGAAIVVANEFLDALPIRQFVYHDETWRERVVVAAPGGGLAFAVGAGVAYGGAGGGDAPRPGAIAELRDGEDEVIAALAARVAPVVALFLDYGPAEPAFGDTLQAVRRHAYCDPLAEPGLADLTAHVQFAAFAARARAAGLEVAGPVSQACFLGRLGIAERTAKLMAANPERAGEIEAATQRLVSPTGMGQLFKAIALQAPGLPVPPGLG